MKISHDDLFTAAHDAAGGDILVPHPSAMVRLLAARGVSISVEAIRRRYVRLVAKKILRQDPTTGLYYLAQKGD